MCDGGNYYQYEVINADPALGIASLSVSHNGQNISVTPGVSFKVTTGTWAIIPTYASGYTFNQASPTYLTVSGSCSTQTATATSTQTATATSTQTANSTNTGNILGTVKFSEVMGDMVCPAGGTPARYVTINADPSAGVLSFTLRSKTTGSQFQAVLGHAVQLPVSGYYIVPSIDATHYSVDASTLQFSVDGKCSEPAATSTQTATTTYAQEAYSTTTTIQTTTTTTVVAPAIPAPAFVLPSDQKEPDHVHYDITPRMAKDGSVAYIATGGVNFGVELPVNPLNGQVRIFLGDANHWRSDYVFGGEQGLVRVSGTNRFKVAFDSMRLSDGPWRVRAAYLSADNYWVYTDTFNFTAKNSGTVINIEPTSTVNIELPAKQGEEKKAHHDKPTIRLVVNDRAVMIAKPVFDREEVEVRVSSAPLDKLQFLVYSIDGALTPRIKDIGGGLRDEVLSRNGIEVWTRLVDMSDLPTGSYRLFARVHMTDGTQMESEPRTITVQHLSHAEEIPVFGDAKSDADIAASLTEDTKNEIRKRVTDPSACVTQEECAVFCSSTSDSKDKCIAFSRVSAVQATTDIDKEVRAAQEAARKQLGEEVVLHIPEIAAPTVIGVTSTPLSTSTAPSSPARVIAKEWKAPAPFIRPSLVDVIPEDALKIIIDRNGQLSAELPPEVDSVPALQSFCGVAEHIDKCTRIVERIIPTAASALADRAEVVRSYEEKSLQVFEQRTGARAFIDTNGNGITDYDKINIYHTDLAKRDTLGSGMSDGALLLGNGNPSKITQVATNSAMLIIGQNMAIENPKITGSTQPKLLAVASAGVLETEKDEAGQDTVKKIVFKGRAPANSFVRVFMFSEPIVVTVKADESGNWSYILDKKLPDGSHTAYAAVADASGRILAKSEPLPFVKTASAISVGATALAPAPVDKSILPGLSPLSMAALIVAMFGIALSVVGVVIGLKKTM